ncbi:hypothetical protein DV735_g158, partial [Chaetothyriales sp. CBS 134920]
MVRTMTTLKPQLVRAGPSPLCNTLDLQAPDAPSAQDHSRQPQHPAPYGYGPAAPHQAQTLRHAEEEAFHHQRTSPRVSDDGAVTDHDYDDAEASDSHDEDMDDDLMDKISSSPSIEDDVPYRIFSRLGRQTAPIPSYLLPPHDPVLNEVFEDVGDQVCADDDDDVWEDIAVGSPDQKPSSDDEPVNILFTAHSAFLDSGRQDPCLRETEDIDFEFVYALHTFVATVEGQANATKGDTMVLLDDSNSYWWLVRVVKDGSIGYLPAEHIETPTERLARLNKHRNIDLSASMLGDNPEKSKNPLKKAMRRRNAKTVQFTAPTYYEPSEYDYSDDEEEEADESQLEPGDAEGSDPAEEHETATQYHDEEVARSAQDNQHYDDNEAVNSLHHTTSNESSNEDQQISQGRTSASTDPLLLASSQEPVSRSRKGVVRNTDSFFKDDSVETKKISLTPRLLRGDSDVATGEQSEARQRSSEETLDKVSVDERHKDHPKKEKKGMLSGLFKRKDKAAKVQIPQDRAEKTSEDSLPHSTLSKDSLDSVTGPERRPSKLQKAPPSQAGSVSSSTEPKAPQSDQAVSSTPAIPPAPVGPAPAPPSLANEVDQGDESAPDSLGVQARGPGSIPSSGPSASAQDGENTRNGSVTEDAQSSAATDAAPDLSPRSRVRSALAADDSEDDDASVDGLKQLGVAPVNQTQTGHRRNDSGMEISPIGSSSGNQNESHFAHEPNYTDEKSASPGPAGGSTSIDLEHTASTSKPSPSTATTHTLSTSRSTPTWSDASLRTYMENDQDIKDLLIIIHDQANVQPVSADHPLMANLFSSERSKLTEMQSQLDNLLLGWMSRKNATLLSR